MTRAVAPDEERIDHGATGPAMGRRPSRELETIKAGVTVMAYSDAHLIDRMNACGQLTDRQYAAAKRVIEQHDDAGFQPRLCAAYAPRGWANGHDDEEEESAGITRFRKLLGGVGEQSAWLLHSLCLEQHPGLRFLPMTQELLLLLAAKWGIEG